MTEKNHKPESNWPREEYPRGDKLKQAREAVEAAEKAEDITRGLTRDEITDPVGMSPNVGGFDPYVPPLVDFEKLGTDITSEEMSGQQLAGHAMDTLRDMVDELNAKHAKLADEILSSKEHTSRLEEEQEAVAKVLASLRTVV